MLEGFEHVKYCTECKEFGECPEHKFESYDSWTSGKKDPSSILVCDHSYNIRWFRGSLTPEGNDGDYSRRGRCLECGSMILGVFKLAFARYQKPDGSDYICDSDNPIVRTSDETIDINPDALVELIRNWDTLTDGTDIIEEDGFRIDEGDVYENTENVIRDDDDHTSSYINSSDSLAFNGRYRCITCSADYIRDDTLTGNGVNSFYCRDCLNSSLERADVPVLVRNFNVVNDYYKDCDFFPEFKTRHWFSMLLEGSTSYVAEIESRYQITDQYLHSLSHPRHECRNCSCEISQVTTGFIKDILGRYDTESKIGWDKVDMITTCESCVTNLDSAEVDLYCDSVIYPTCDILWEGCHCQPYEEHSSYRPYSSVGFNDRRWRSDDDL